MTDTVDTLPKTTYENRIVAFIDILGFRELVSLSALHFEKLKALAQSYSCDEKVYPKYESLLNDWLMIVGSENVNKTAGTKDD